MQEIITEQPERAVLIGIDTNTYDVYASLRELAELAATAGAQVVGQFCQNRETPDAGTFIGQGKLKEIRDFCAENQVELLLVDDELSGSQLRNIEEFTGIRTVDRTALILDIFAQRAHSREGRLQVELAQQKYRLPRLMGLGKSLSRLGGGIGTRGPGETKLETDRRHIRRRIHSLEEALAELSKQRSQTRERRKKNSAVTVALVGYTNVGKSSLLNRLTQSEVYVQNQLFATLDPTAREFVLPSGQHIILIDTVGLIQRLPHQLVEAFHSTLEIAADADLILNVCDFTNPDVDRQLEVTRDLLAQLGCGGIPTITVYNKIDLNPEAVPQSNSRSVFISARTGENLDLLFSAIEEALSGLTCKMQLQIPYAETAVLGLIRQHGRILTEQYGESGTELEVVVPCRYQKALLPYQLP